MSEQTSQSIGTIRCEQELKEHLFLGRIELPEQQERSCIIHFLPEGDDLGRRRFVREAMIGFDVSRDHRNLLSTLFFGVWGDGRLFVAVECVEGRALSELTTHLRGRFAAIQAIAREMLEALESLHERGVAHGRVVPSNILVGADGIVRLGNFSRARRMPAGESGAAAMRADLRALGELIFELVADVPLAQLQLFVDAEPKACLPTETTPELVALIEYLLDEQSETSATTALMQLRDQDSSSPQTAMATREQLALMGGDLETAQALLPPASEVDAELADDDLSADDGDEEIALLFASMLNRLGGESKNPPVATASPLPPPTQPAYRQHVIHGLALAVALLALIIASYGSLQSRDPAPGKPVPMVAQQAPSATEATQPRAVSTQTERTGTALSATEQSIGPSVAEFAPQSPDASTELLTGPGGASDEFSTPPPDTLLGVKILDEKLYVDGIGKHQKPNKEKTQRPWLSSLNDGSSKLSGDMAGRSGLLSTNRAELAFIARTEVYNDGLRLVVEGGLLDSSGLSLIGRVTNNGGQDFQVAKLGLRRHTTPGHSDRDEEYFAFRHKEGACTTGGRISNGATCHFTFKAFRQQNDPDLSLSFIVSNQLGMRRAIVTLTEDL